MTFRDILPEEVPSGPCCLMVEATQDGGHRAAARVTLGRVQSGPGSAVQWEQGVSHTCSVKLSRNHSKKAKRISEIDLNVFYLM